MSESFKALCNDSYVNQKVQAKMELPRTRETILDFFERVRKRFPEMSAFRKWRDELALEGPQQQMPHRWLAVRGASLRTGCVNAERFAEAYALHRHVLEIAPTFLTLSPIDIDHVELMYGFDIVAGGNHDAIVLDALIQGTPLAALADVPGAVPAEFQPMLALKLGKQKEIDVRFEVRTRPADPARGVEGEHDPISVCLFVSRPGPVADVRELPAVFSTLAEIGEELIEQRVVPGLLVPIREAIGTGNS
jgi:hypothetical protein